MKTTTIQQLIQNQYNTTAIDPDKKYTVAQTTALTGVPSGTLYSAIKSERLLIKNGQITGQDLLEWLATKRHTSQNRDATPGQLADDEIKRRVNRIVGIMQSYADYHGRAGLNARVHTHTRRIEELQEALSKYKKAKSNYRDIDRITLINILFEMEERYD